jgi:hypothetical protein
MIVYGYLPIRVCVFAGEEGLERRLDLDEEAAWLQRDFVCRGA